MDVRGQPDARDVLPSGKNCLDFKERGKYFPSSGIQTPDPLIPQPTHYTNYATEYEK
jgi:hypothetical protein